MNGSESLKIVLLTRVSFALQSDSKIPMSRELPFIRRGIIILEIFVFIFVTSFHLSRIIFEICSVIEKYRWSSSVLRTSFQVISKRISRKKFRVLRGRREIATNSVTSETRAGGKGRGGLVESHAEQGFRVTRERMVVVQGKDLANWRVPKGGGGGGGEGGWLAGLGSVLFKFRRSFRWCSYVHREIQALCWPS